MASPRTKKRPPIRSRHLTSVSRLGGEHLNILKPASRRRIRYHSGKDDIVWKGLLGNRRLQELAKDNKL